MYENHLWTEKRMTEKWYKIFGKRKVRRRMNKKINETLSELIIGILAMGVMIQAADILICRLIPSFHGMIPGFMLGFWIGVGIAVGLSVHMYRSIDRALNMYGEDAEKYIHKAYLFRTVAILVMAGIVKYFKIGYIMAFFLGVLCLKFGAFLQPLVHMCRSKFRKKQR